MYNLILISTKATFHNLLILNENDLTLKYDTQKVRRLNKKYTWTPLQVLEHISLTSEYLLIIIDKLYYKVLKQNVLYKDKFDYAPRIKIIRDTIHGHKKWENPKHHYPDRNYSLIQIKERFQSQEEKLIEIIEKLRFHEKRNYLRTMSNLEIKLDCYEWIYFLICHANRHMFILQERGVNIKV